MGVEYLVRGWRHKAACRGPSQDIFFPPQRTERRRDKRRREQLAKEICSGCPVMEACREYAIGINEPYGVWGGLTENERRRAVLGDVG